MIFWPGLIAIGVLYVTVFAIGVYATRSANDSDGDSLTELMLAGRNLPMWVGLLTMTATWVGGGYINGTAEQTYANGILWGAQAGIGYALSLMLGGLVYARVMRRHGFATLIDPLEARYGHYVAGILMIPAVLAELFWSAAILVALGGTFGAVIGLDLQTSILTSSVVAVGYTVYGGLRAVAWTDVIQLFLILAGLALAIPFTITSAGGLDAVLAAAGEIGFASTGDAITYGDWCIILILGGIPWNVYFQRVLSSPSPNAAARTSMIAGLLCAVMAIPPLLLGLAGRAMDWSVIDTQGIDVAAELAATPSLVLPYLLRYAVPEWVSVLGLGAVAAAVMSSVDSSILSASSLVAWNGYRKFLHADATANEMTRAIRALVLILGTAATVIALTASSVSALWYLCGDIVFCVLFPQLTLALFDKKANRMGALSGLAISCFIRLSGGDATLGLTAFISWPVVDGGEFPFRTLAMVLGLTTAVVVARLTQSYDRPKPLDRLGLAS